MEHQYSIYDYAEPEYNGTFDEILRLHAEKQLECNIQLIKCCGTEPRGKFRSCKEYWIECPVCGRKTKVHKKYYQAMQSWNRGESEEEVYDNR